MKHPEQKEGEVFIGNYTQDGFDEIRLKTKRKGRIPYDEEGEAIPYYKKNNFHPVFFLASENHEGAE